MSESGCQEANDNRGNPEQRPPRPAVGNKVTVVLGAQWGDEGKGKVVDLLAQDADIVCRCQVGWVVRLVGLVVAASLRACERVPEMERIV